MRWALYRVDPCGHVTPGKLTNHPWQMHDQPLWCQYCRTDRKIYRFEKVVETDGPPA